MGMVAEYIDPMLRRLFTPLLNRLPSQCLVCQRWPAQPLCGPCLARFGEPRHRCATCALPAPEGVARCGACTVQAPALDACHAAVDYAYPWAAVLARFKFGQQPGLAVPLAQLLQRLPATAQRLNDATLVLPMPLANERLAERGFNQSLLLAQALLRAPRQRLDAHLLLRPVHRLPQSALTRAERLRNVSGVFAVAPESAHRLQEARVLLVDDVMTSGASLAAAASVLRQAGAVHVAALVVARTA